MTSLTTQLAVLKDDLADVGGTASWAVASVFNTLLQLAKEQAPNDPVISSIQPITQSSSSSNSTASVATVRALTGQILAALPLENQF